MAKRLTKAEKTARIVSSKRSASSRARATRAATTMVPRKKAVNATRLTRG